MSGWIRIGGTEDVAMWRKGSASIRRTYNKIGKYQVSGVDDRMRNYRTLAEAKAAVELALAEREGTT